MPDYTQLLARVKNDLDITWQDDATDDKVSGIMSRAYRKVSEYAGGNVDLTDGKGSILYTDESELFFNLCRYLYNNCTTKEFEENYLSDIITVRNKNRIERELWDDEEEAEL